MSDSSSIHHGDRARGGWNVAILIAILLLGVGLRLRWVDQPLNDAFSWRQASTAMMAENFYRTNANILYPEVNWSGPGPNYQGREFQTFTWTVALLYRVFGQHEMIGRLVSIAAGLWSMIALYGLTRRVIDPSRALMTTAIYALMPAAVFIDREFLPDPTMLALILTAAWMLIIHLQEQTGRHLLLFGVFLTLGLLTKLPSLCILPALVYATVVIDRGRLRAVGITGAIALLLVGAYYAWTIHLALSTPPYHIAGQGNFVVESRLMDWIRRGFYIPDVAWHLVVWMWWKPIAACVLVGAVAPVVFWRRAARDINGTAAAPAFYQWWLAGFAMLYLVAARELRDNPWNLHVLNAVGAGLAAGGLACAAGFVRPAWRTGALAAGVAIVLGVTLVRAQYVNPYLYQPGHTQGGYAMGVRLAELTRPGELVVTIADDVGDPMPIYVSGRRGWVLPIANLVEGGDTYTTLPSDEILIRMLDEMRQRGADWLAITAHHHDDSEPQLDVWTDRPAFMAHVEQTSEVAESDEQFTIYRLHPAQDGQASLVP